MIQDKGLNRQTLDKFYTKPETVELCMQAFNSVFANFHENTKYTIIEPSAGNGAWIEEIKKLSENYLFYDIQPEHPEIEQQDFLELNFHYIKYEIIFIGNPPFGRQSSLAIKFIKKCCEVATYIAFVLPKSFKKESMKKHFDNYYHLIYEMDLPKNSFFHYSLPRTSSRKHKEEEADVPCVFQIWLRKNYQRLEIEKQIPQGFKFISIEKENDRPDISFRRVGVNAGVISQDLDKSAQSHYFIKFTNNKNISENLENLKKISFDIDNTVGPRSISKPELIMEFNKYL